MKTSTAIVENRIIACNDAALKARSDLSIVGFTASFKLNNITKHPEIDATAKYARLRETTK
jgi:hypothetical protein